MGYTSAASIAFLIRTVRINREHKAAVGTLKRGLEHALAAGHLLLEAKRLVPHGQWLPWLSARCQIPERTAQVYMRLAKRMPKSARPADLTIIQALELLDDAAGDLDELQLLEGLRSPSFPMRNGCRLSATKSDGVPTSTSFGICPDAIVNFER